MLDVLFPITSAEALFLEIQSFRVALLQNQEVLESAHAEAPDCLGLACEYPQSGRNNLFGGLVQKGMLKHDIRDVLEKVREQDVPLPYYSPPNGLVPFWYRLRGDYYAGKIMEAEGPAELSFLSRKAAKAYSEAGLFQMAGNILVMAGAHVRLFSLEEETRRLFQDAAEYYLEGHLHGHAAYTFFAAEDFARAALEAAFIFDHLTPEEEPLISPEIFLTLASLGMEQSAALNDATFSNLLATLQRGYAYRLLAEGLPMLAVLHFLDAAANALAGGHQETAKRALHQVERRYEDSVQILRPLVAQTAGVAG